MSIHGISGATVLDGAQWRAAADDHAAEVDVRVDAHRQRRRRGVAHPVEDFLFEYYSLRPSQLRRWQPGVDVVLLDGRQWLDTPGFISRPDIAADAVSVDPTCFTTGALGHRRTGALAIARLLRATEGRRAAFNCFGLHEWAMVHRSAANEVRHRDAPLRVSSRELESTIEELGLNCTHYDAFRFFTPTAAPMNAHRLSRAEQMDHEQPGCIHAGMDLYKWAYKLRPLIPADLLLACFDHARSAREVDMRASPYDLASWGYQPIEIETPVGRQQFVLEQRRLAQTAAELRRRLIELLDRSGL